MAAGRLKDRNKMERRLGEIQARHPQVERSLRSRAARHARRRRCRVANES